MVYGRIVRFWIYLPCLPCFLYCGCVFILYIVFDIYRLLVVIFILKIIFVFNSLFIN